MIYQVDFHGLFAEMGAMLQSITWNSFSVLEPGALVVSRAVSMVTLF
jgi:hypothetical protein